jgi:xanthine dehydrogenase YagS FAD-binding subunit
MRPFRYARVTSPEDAVALAVADPTSAFIAGGTELTNLMRDRVLTPDLVVDVNAVAADDVTLAPREVRIGALARMTDVARNATVRKRLPVLSEALLASASGQVRNMASIGGNLMQRTRCWYYRDATMPCNTRDPGSGCPAIDGENRWHAILGGSEECIRVHPSDLAVALTALDAAVRTHGPGGARRIPIGRFYRLPGDTPHVETVLEHGELIVGVDVPLTEMAARSAYRKVRDRASFEFAIVSVAVALELRGRVVQDVRIALGGVAPAPWRPLGAEKALRGRRLTGSTVERAAAAAVQGAVPREHNGFKVELAQRTLASVLGRLGGNG